MKYNLDYKHVKENVLMNVLPYLEHIEAKEVMMNIITLDIARRNNSPHMLINSALFGTGLGLLSLSLTGPFWTVLTASALGVSVINLVNCRKENKGFNILKGRLLYCLTEEKKLDEAAIQNLLDSIPPEEYVEFLENSSYNI